MYLIEDFPLYRPSIAHLLAAGARVEVVWSDSAAETLGCAVLWALALDQDITITSDDVDWVGDSKANDGKHGDNGELHLCFVVGESICPYWVDGDDSVGCV